MADYFTEFSIVMDMSESEKRWIDRFLVLGKALADESICETIAVKFGESRSGADHEAWFHSFGYQQSSVNALSELLHRFLIKFDRDDVVILQWANTCSKPRVDAFGGGAAVISRLGIHFINTAVWADGVSQKVGRKLAEERAVHA
jgi:hypothetical protein